MHFCIDVSESCSLVACFWPSTESFITCLPRFIAWRWKPSSIHSDHGTNFRNFMPFFSIRKPRKQFIISVQLKVSIGTSFPNARLILVGYGRRQWKALRPTWEWSGTTNLTSRKCPQFLHKLKPALITVLWALLPCSDEEGIEMLTPGHFLIGRPIQAIPDHTHSSRSLGLLWRWYLCQGLVRHFWERWRNEYIIALRNYSKWMHPKDNFQVGDVVVVRRQCIFFTLAPLPESSKPTLELTD